jgi:ethanolamine utilization protein EutQ (cupin superfamily)
LEIHPGVFVSNIATDVGWEFDPEVNGEAHVLVEETTAFAGLERYREPIEPLVWTLPDREVVLILEGAVRIEIADGPTLELTVGDIASLPKGALTTWHITAPFKEMWFFGRPYELEGTSA